MPLVESLAVVGAIVAPVTTVLTLLVNRLRERDKLQYDQEMATIKVAVSKCEIECKSTRDTAVVDRQRREDAELRASKLEGESVSVQRENRELRLENRELRDRLLGSNHAGTDEH